MQTKKVYCLLVYQELIYLNLLDLNYHIDVVYFDYLIVMRFLNNS